MKYTINRIEGPSDIFPDNNLLIHQLIEKQVKETPDHPAVLFDSSSLTYRELNERANQVAHYLKGNGLKHDDPVAICLERSIELVTVLLGVIKAGGAYVPVDPSQPSRRIHQLLAEINPPFVITSNEQSSILPAANNSERLLIEDCFWRGSCKEDLSESNEDEDSLMYIIYTSGSTGKPKGVMNTHRALNNRLQWMQKEFQLTENDRILQKTPYSFDVSVWEFFWPLMTGAALVVAEPEGHKDPEYLMRTIIEYGITTIHFVPSMLQLFLEGKSLSERTPLKRVICSGEALKKSTEKQFFSLFKDTELYNLYGPTEAAIDVTYWKCIDNPSDPNVPIGYPLSNIQLFILDGDGNLVRDGEEGELYIGGAGLAKGYYNQPELTEERFIDNPFSTDQKLYKSGDVCKLRKDGAIEYIGRNDFQVKIRGMRIELGEIESIIEQQAGIKHSIVTAYENKEQKYLAAYVTLMDQEKWDDVRIREDLKTYLPDFKIPSFFTVLDEFPLSANGKIDRKQLPSPLETNSARISHPQTEMERQLSNMWGTYLGHDSIDSDTHFLHMGGNSLFAARLSKNLKDKYSIPADIQTIFRHPTIKALASYIENSNQPPMIKEKEIQENRIHNENMSYAQKRLWFINELEGESHLYNLPGYIEVHGKLNIERFRKSLDLIISKQEVLKSNFSSRQGEPLCSTDQYKKSDLEYLDLTDQGYPEAVSFCRNKMKLDAATAFDLSNGNLYRFRLYKLSGDHHYFYYNFHHIIFDGWSETVFLNAVFALYENSHSYELPSSYQDYIDRQTISVNSPEMDEHMKYWKSKLKGDIPQIKLFKTQKELKVPSNEGKTESFSIPAVLMKKLEQICANNGATLYMGMLALYKLLIYRLSKEKDIVVGTPVAGRNNEEDRETIGMFVNTVVVRDSLDEKMNFLDVLSKIKTSSLEALLQGGVPFEKVVEAVQPNRSLNQNPLFQYMFAFQNFPDHNKPAGDIKLGDPKILSNGTSKFDLTFFIEREEKGMKGKWEYRTGIFDRDHITDLTSMFLELLRSAVTHANLPLTELSLLTEEEENELIYDLNRTEKVFPDSLLHELFEKQVVCTPGHTAVIYEGKKITYRELDEKSNQLAHLLIQKGVVPDTPVGIVMNRSIEMVTGIMGILKAGGAYLPIDVDTPKNRMTDILLSAEATICLTNVMSLSLQSERIEILNYCNEEDQISGFSKTKPNVKMTPSNLVSVYYTSGSTGAPKGVSSTHKGWVNRVCWMQNKHQLNEGEIALQKTTLTFDDAAIEFFWPLMAGGAVALIPPGMHKDPVSIIDYAIKYNVSLLQFVPSMLQMVVEEMSEEKKEKLSNLRVVVSSGEALKSELVNSFYKKMPGKLFNTWGATEVSIDSTCFDCWPDSQMETGSEIVSVGKPIDNNRIYVLDSFLKPVPFSVPGDLYISGIGLARGYLNNPEKTKASFVDDPFHKGEKMYRTGDRGYLTKQGNIMFLGREDNQVKIRGMRVELGEIENKIRAVDGVKDAVVLFKKNDDVSGLAAYFTCEEQDDIRLKTKQSIQLELPDYMVPGLYVQLDEFPLNSNGKVDRNKLPSASEEHLVVNSRYAEPKTFNEQKVLDVWKEKLKLSQIGINDNFFELGGHSLLAVQIISSINKLFSTAVPVKVLFEKPTVSELAQALNQYNHNTDNHILMNRVSEHVEIPLSDAQKRIWFLEYLNPGTSYNMPLVLNFDGQAEALKLESAINRLIKRHDSLKTVFRNKKGKPVQVINNDGSIKLKLIDKNDDIQRITQKECEEPFDLSKGPLVKGTLVKEKDKNTLILVFHHIICDGWSLKVIKDELIALYSGENLPDDSEVVQYPSYTLWQSEFEHSPESKKQITFWKEEMSGPLPVLQLPTDFNDNRRANHTIRKKLDGTFSEEIKKFSMSRKLTPFMVFYSAYVSLLSRLADQKDIIIGTPIINRKLEELERSVGIYLNTLPLRAIVSEDLTSNELFLQSKKTILKAFANGDIPFEKIVEEVQPERNLNRNPLFDVLINYRSFEERKTYMINNLEVKEVEVDEIESKFFLTLYIEETSQGFNLNLSYKNNMFSTARMEVFLHQFVQLLEASITYPERKLSEISLITADRQSLPDPAAVLGDHSYPRITDQIEEWAKAAPYNIAVEERGIKYSYERLNATADKISRNLLAECVLPGEVVAIYGKKSYKTLVTILGVLKADAVFLTIDENVPEKRLESILEESNTTFILTTMPVNDVHQKTMEQSNASIIEIDRLLMRQEGERQINSVVKVKPNEDAYIFFTSGTTGKPKAILGTHAGLSHFLNWQKEEFNILPEDRFSHLTNVTFDVYLRDALLPLISGAALCIPEGDESSMDFLHREEITRCHAVPSLSTLWLKESSEFQSLPFLKSIFFAGEPLSHKLISQWKERCNAEIICLYGQTETTLAKGFQRESEVTSRYENLPIGNFLPDTQLFILNKFNKLCGIGEPGEIVVRTPYRTKGYINQPHDGFTQNNFSEDPNDFYYHTGDLGRYSPDGMIEIYGRNDDQIKVRGVRINKNEIMSAMMNLPGVNDCYILDGKMNGETTITAYVDLESGEILHSLRQKLFDILPMAMIPNHFISVPQLPVTSNGKVDRQKLKQLQPMKSEVFTPIESNTERILLDIWKDLIGKEDICNTDNFFELGGHSLLIIRMAASIQDRLDLEIQLKDVFQNPTVNTLAAYMNSNGKVKKTLPIKKVRRTKHLV
ncbi:amino acid adenylation domain-containing protein [Bacillus haikouensis]|uniref:non-ribosomal peptide synthetase n=1 Tax=Bacillus haikouensis TaxID=1510468 RepID=UPI0015526C9B|nr:non-ribosomal peptide synthetase [Bacillus haikouensis]NQD65520.1 amino acid adenylation domain-containing protein [Bacillus haikouensis]